MLLLGKIFVSNEILHHVCYVISFLESDTDYVYRASIFPSIFFIIRQTVLITESILCNHNKLRSPFSI